ncbi:metal-dependent hydrolase [Candidatus Woesearchaeota archaeon]|nr:MAG: metal-dependent hydrolase [Candidatus Woesearchaeota archaeon]
MRHFTHVAGGILAGIISMKLGAGIAGFPAAIFGSVLPDSDLPTGHAVKRFLKKALLKHRGVTHSLLFAAIVSAGVWFLSRDAGMGLLLGIASHLALDSLNPMGVELFWPLKKRVRGKIKYRIDNDIKLTALLIACSAVVWVYF